MVSFIRRHDVRFQGEGDTGGGKEGPMLRRALVLLAALAALGLAVSAAFGGVPKLLVLEHFADYFG